MNFTLATLISLFSIASCAPLAQPIIEDRATSFTLVLYTQANYGGDSLTTGGIGTFSLPVILNTKLKKA